MGEWKAEVCGEKVCYPPQDDALRTKTIMDLDSYGWQVWSLCGPKPTPATQPTTQPSP